MEERIEFLNKCFSQLIEGYILRDLKNLMNIQIDAQGYGGCTIPAAMTIISAMEMFGTLLTPNPKDDDGRKYLLEFMEHYIPEITEEDRKSIVFNYRHKMMHTFFPKVSDYKVYAITKKPGNTLILIDKPTANQRILNVPLLYEFFLKGITRLRKKIFEEKNEPIINSMCGNLRIEKGTTSYKPFDTSSLSTNQTTQAP